MTVTRETDRERELAELERLLRQPGRQKPAPVPVPVCRPTATTSPIAAGLGPEAEGCP